MLAVVCGIVCGGKGRANEPLSIATLTFPGLIDIDW